MEVIHSPRAKISRVAMRSFVHHIFVCSSGNIDTAEPWEPDTPVEIETSTEDSSVSASESAENDAGDIDTSTKSDDGLANASESIEIDGGEKDTSSSFSNCSEDDWECSLEAEQRADNINHLIETLPLIDSQMFAECFVDTLATETGFGFTIFACWSIHNR